MPFWAKTGVPESKAAVSILDHILLVSTHFYPFLVKSDLVMFVFSSYTCSRIDHILLGCGSFVRGRKRKKGDSIPFILSRRDYMPRPPDEATR